VYVSCILDSRSSSSFLSISDYLPCYLGIPYLTGVFEGGNVPQWKEFCTPAVMANDSSTSSSWEKNLQNVRDELIEGSSKGVYFDHEVHISVMYVEKMMYLILFCIMCAFHR
jgi:hypothetical protein